MDRKVQNNQTNSGHMQFITVNEALDRIGFGRFHWFLVAVSGLGFGKLDSHISR